MTEREQFEITEPARVNMSADHLGRIDEAMERSIREKVMKGMVTLVARHGKVVQCKAYGEAKEGIPMKTDAIFRFASMSKAVGAAAIMQLYDRGLVMPSDKLSDYIPAFADVKVAVPKVNGEVVLVPPKRPITIHDLLTMTSGITAVKSEKGFHPAAAYCARCYREAGIVDTMHPLAGSIGDLTERLAGMPLAAHPGERWDYTNLSSIILGRITELVSGMDLKSYLEKNIFEPLDMRETTFFPDESKWDRVPDVFACGTMERLDGLDVPGTDDTRLPYAKDCSYYNIAAGLTGTVRDYYQFARMLCDRGEYEGKRILSPHAVDLMTYPHTRGVVHESSVHGKLEDVDRTTGPSMYGHHWGYMVDVQTDYNTIFNYMGLGSYGWHGYWGSVFNIWPDEDLIAIFISQVSPVDQSWKTQERFLNLVAGAVME